eukprot:99572-Rhodomonas_salina.1
MPLRDVRYRHSLYCYAHTALTEPMALRSMRLCRYTISGTDTAYAATRPRTARCRSASYQPTCLLYRPSLLPTCCLRGCPVLTY